MTAKQQEPRLPAVKFQKAWTFEG